MKSTPIFPGYVAPIAIGYKYCYQNILGFIYFEVTGSTVPGVPYLSCYPDKYLMFPSDLFVGLNF